MRTTFDMSKKDFDIQLEAFHTGCKIPPKDLAYSLPWLYQSIYEIFYTIITSKYFIRRADEILPQLLDHIIEMHNIIIENLKADKNAPVNHSKEKLPSMVEVYERLKDKKIEIKKLDNIRSAVGTINKILELISSFCEFLDYTNEKEVEAFKKTLSLYQNILMQIRNLV